MDTSISRLHYGILRLASSCVDIAKAIIGCSFSYSVASHMPVPCLKRVVHPSLCCHTIEVVEGVGCALQFELLQFILVEFLSRQEPVPQLPSNSYHVFAVRR